MMISLYKL